MPDINKKIDDYFSLAKEIHQFFGYQEDWVTIPMDDGREYYWFLIEEPLNIEGKPEAVGGELVYSLEPLTADAVRDGAIYVADVYTQRFLPKWIYRTKTHTMVAIDTHTDGNKYLILLDNARECKDPEITSAR